MKDRERTEPPQVADERAQLVGFLEFHRDTLDWKCTGLTDEQLRRTPVPPSNLSLLGLVRHLTDVERGWFRRGVAGEDAPPLYYSDDNPDGDIADVDALDVAAVLDAWREQVRASREIVASRSLDDTFGRRPGEVFSVRWLLIHMIEEYSRHNGHADLLREVIDGATGE